MTKRRITETDIAIGRALRLTRKNASMTQGQLAEKIGVTFQQVQKYERGLNRISVSTLAKMHNKAGLDHTHIWGAALLGSMMEAQDA
jgi:transcriptional regulator with XRE-family HTH domain